MNLSMDNGKAPDTFATAQTLPGFGWVVQTHCSSLKHCYHALWQPWQEQVVAHHLPSGQGLAVDAQQEASQTSPSPFLTCVPFSWHPVSLLMLLSLSCDTNHAFTPKATQRADFAL